MKVHQQGYVSAGHGVGHLGGHRVGLVALGIRIIYKGTQIKYKGILIEYNGI